LEKGQSVVTKPLNHPRVPLDEDVDLAPVAMPPDVQETEPSPPPAEVTAGRAGPAWRVLFHVTAVQSSTVGLDVWRVTVLGRADALSAFHPDLDFAPFGAVRYGVSRRHALIRPGDQMLYLIDQNSTNGTWVNGQRLLPGRDFPLTDGDVIELGALRMTLRIVQYPNEHEGQQRRQVPSSNPLSKWYFGRSSKR
jgi:hypothetical protein